MAQGKDPCIPRHWAMGCPVWTWTRASHSRVICWICPNTDVASISGVLHFVWPLAQSLSSMVKPTRSPNSSWHSLWDLRGTQAPQLRQSNNTLGGLVKLPWYECHLDFTDDQSTLVQVMAWCRQATSHYLSQCWPRSLSPYGVTRPQWVNSMWISNYTHYKVWGETA